MSLSCVIVSGIHKKAHNFKQIVTSDRTICTRML